MVVYSLVYQMVNRDCHKVSFKMIKEMDLFIASHTVQVLFTINENKK